MCTKSFVKFVFTGYIRKRLLPIGIPIGIIFPIGSGKIPIGIPIGKKNQRTGLWLRFFTDWLTNW